MFLFLFLFLFLFFLIFFYSEVNFSTRNSIEVLEKELSEELPIGKMTFRNKQHSDEWPDLRTSINLPVGEMTLRNLNLSEKRPSGIKTFRKNDTMENYEI